MNIVVLYYSGWFTKWGKKEMNQVIHVCLSKVTRAAMAVVWVVRRNNILQCPYAAVMKVRSTSPQSMQARNIGTNSCANIK